VQRWHSAYFEAAAGKAIVTLTADVHFAESCERSAHQFKSAARAPMLLWAIAVEGHLVRASAWCGTEILDDVREQIVKLELRKEPYCHRENRRVIDTRLAWGV